MRTLLAACIVIALTAPLVAQTQTPAQEGGRGVGALGQAVRRPPPPAGPTPRLPDGTVDLSGLWVGGGTDSDLETAGG